ncbi:phosphoribosyl transferase [Roseateles aquatilis]|uniref:Phosphoribosyl transferase n=1 Tax=Roseateles aquatilis TaxID=431061 RepID=A0A246JHY4_9BURK|nr:phosphoribosyltransferase [Roseateles aquatilis]OWQ92133.1 phosphoribosyl transferase [Roseateles aquatilis]
MTPETHALLPLRASADTRLAEGRPQPRAPQHPFYADRRDAGRHLAARLTVYAHQDDMTVLALPRGGVPVAAEIARALGAPLDVLVVRKLGLPGQPEYAMGAIASGDVRVLNAQVLQQLAISASAIDIVTRAEVRELHRREKLYRGDRPMPPLRGRRVIVVDDGMATGATMRAAVQALRVMAPARIVVAVPVAAAETCHLLGQDADEVVCGQTPERFRSVGQWYERFEQTSDDEVRRWLDAADERRAAVAHLP